MSQEDSESGATFNIGKQEGVITNVGRDMHVHGDQRNQALVLAPQLLSEIEELRKLLPVSGVSPEVIAEADRGLGDAAEELRRPSPDAGKVAGGVERAAETLKRFGGLAAAGLALIEPLQRIASLLGPVGNSLLRLLH